MTRKNTRVLSCLVFLLLLSMTLSINRVRVSAAPSSPYIMVVPEETWDPAIAPGMNYTISVYTDHSVNNVTAWDLSLSFNPSVLQMGFNITDTWTGDGSTATFTTTREAVVESSEKVYVDQVLMTRDLDYYILYGPFYESEIIFFTAPSVGAEVKAEYTWTGLTNGDLIAAAKDLTATLLPGTIDNTLGKLSVTTAFFYYTTVPSTTSGPGTLAYVTFRVISRGISDIVLGPETSLYAPGQPPYYSPPYYIIDASKPPGATSPPYGSDHIGHGDFWNFDDVAVIGLTTPTTVIQGDTMSINVTVANGGDVTRTFNITVFADTTFVGNLTVNDLATRDIATALVNWNTTTVTAGKYTINATAWLPPSDDDPSDNTKTTTTEIKTLHDVAVINLEIPEEANIGDLLPVKVTVANQGTFEENVNLTIYYRPELLHPPPLAVMNTTTFTLSKRPTSTTIQANWNTTTLSSASYNITATITIDTDEDPGDNKLYKPMTLNLGHDVSITELSVTPIVFVGETVTISATVQNVGGLNETLVEVKVTCGTTVVGSQQVPSLNIGNSATLSFTWSTIGSNPGIYGMEAEAILDTDVDPTNNRMTKTFSVAAAVGTIAGLVKDATGSPVEGVSVTCGTYTNTTKADGSYRLSNVPAGNYTVTASRNGYQTSSQTSIRVVAGQTTKLNFTLTLLTTGHVTGTVTDASTGNPIEGAQVTAGGNSVSTNATGDYSIELAAGTYTVTVSAGGYQSSSETDVNVVAGETITMDFMLNPDQPLNILLYAAIAAVAIIIVIAVTVIYLRRRKKAT